MTSETAERLHTAGQATKIMVDEFGSTITRVVLFGSVARGKAGPDSDIDLCVVLPTWRELADELSNHRLANHLRQHGISVGAEAMEVHLTCFDDRYLRQMVFGAVPESCEVTTGVIEALRQGKVLYG